MGLWFNTASCHIFYWATFSTYTLHGVLKLQEINCRSPFYKKVEIPIRLGNMATYNLLISFIMCWNSLQNDNQADKLCDLTWKNSLQDGKANDPDHNRS